MKRLVQLLAVFTVSIAMLFGGVSPASASPDDPVTLDALRDSPAYRTDHADVLRLYRAFFDREPDVEGTLYWMGAYDSGATLDDLAWAFANSTEFINAFGDTLTDTEFLTVVYSNVLGRTPDDEGMEYWLGQMKAGLSQSGVVRWVVANPEFINAYPYADTGGDLSGALLKLADMPDGWVVASAATRDLAAGECEGLFMLPERAMLFASFEDDPNSGPFVSQGVHAYPTVAGASAYLTRVSDGLAKCASTSDSTGWDITLSVMAFDSFGDDSLAIRVRMTDPDSDAVVNGAVVIVRYGASITAISHFTAATLDTVQTKAMVTLATDRLISVVDPVEKTS